MDEDNHSNWLTRIWNAIRERHIENLLTAVTSAIGVVAVFLLEKGNSIPLYPYPFVVALIMVIGGVAWLVLRTLIRTGPIPKAEKVSPSAAIGCRPFFRDHGELFRALERKAEIGDLLSGVLNDGDSGVVLLYGAPRTGKTSVLQAGLEYQKGDVRFVYWRPEERNWVADFRETVVDKIGIDLGSNLTDVASGVTDRAIIVMDQFELIQMDGPECKPFVDFLAAVCNQQRPRRLQVVLAIQEDYLSEFERHDNRIKIKQRIRIESFPISSAKKVMEAILTASDVRINRRILKDYVRNMATKSRVSPSDIAIVTSVFAEWSRSSGQRYLSWEQYLGRGGAFGVLVEYLENWLNTCRFSEVVRRQLVKALLRELVDSAGMIKPQGASVKDIAGSDTSGLQDLKFHLRALAEPGWGVLEELKESDGSVRYRFSNERFLPTLSHLAQKRPKALGDSAIGNIVLDQYGWWKEHGDSRFLLKGRLLRQISRYYQELVRSEPSFAIYLRNSKVASRKPKLIMAAGVILASTAVWYGFQVATSVIQHTHLNDWQLPPELYERQNELQTLDIDSRLMSGLGWLKSNTLQELKITNCPLASLDGIEKLTVLRTLSLDLTGSTVDNLKILNRLNELRTLSLNLGKSKIKNLADLASLTKLENLSLQIRASAIDDLSYLEKLSNLTNLTLEMHESQSGMIVNLAKIKTLRYLTLIISGSTDVSGSRDTQDPLTSDIVKGAAGEGGLSGLGLASQLEGLTLDLRESTIRKLPNLAQLTGLKKLSLLVIGSAVSEIPELDRLSGLQYLEIKAAAVKSLPALSQLPKLNTLVLDLDKSQVKELPKLPPQLTTVQLDSKSSGLLKLNASDSIRQVHDLELHLKNMGASELAALNQLQQIDTLTLYVDWSQIPSVPDLAALPHLETLTLHISGQAPGKPTELTQFHNIHNLTLDLEQLQVKQTPDLIGFKELTSLALNLHASQVESLPDIREFHELRKVRIRLSAIETLKNLNELTSLHQLQNLDLDIEGSDIDIKDAPDLAQIGALQTTLNIRGSATKNLAQIRRLGGVTKITIGREIQSLADLPRSVRGLRIKW